MYLKDLAMTEKIPNIFKNSAGATRIINDMIEKYNALLVELEQLDAIIHQHKAKINEKKD